VSDAASTMTMSNQETVTSGSAHHTRRDGPSDAGGGGGRGTLEGAVMPSLPLMVLMTVTEVTTRIAIVGMAGIVGLLLVSRARTPRRYVSVAVGTRRFSQQLPAQVVPASLSVGRITLRRSGTVSSRAVGLAVVTIAVGLAVGIGLSVALVAALGALGLGGS
jgi:hypothetical protein